MSPEGPAAKREKLQDPFKLTLLALISVGTVSVGGRSTLKTDGCSDIDTPAREVVSIAVIGFPAMPPCRFPPKPRSARTDSQQVALRILWPVVQGECFWLGDQLPADPRPGRRVRVRAENGNSYAGGILLSAVLTFFVVPAAFYLFEGKRVARMEEEQNRGPRAAPVGEQALLDVPGLGRRASQEPQPPGAQV